MQSLHVISILLYILYIAAPEFLASPGGKHKPSVSPSAAKISTLRKLGKIIGKSRADGTMLLV